MYSKSTRSTSSRRPWSLAARLTAWYAGSSFALVLVASGLLYLALSRNLDKEDDQVLADKVNVLLFARGPRPSFLRRSRLLAQAIGTKPERPHQ